MNQITPVIKIHTTQEDQGTYLQSLIIEYRGNNYLLPGCTGTVTYAFSESVCLYVLSINRTLSRIYLFAFMSSEPDYISMTSLNSHKEVLEVLGSKWESMKPERIVKRLMDCLF
jgi:hypothetical protein